MATPRTPLVTVAADSISQAGDRVTTMAIELPWSHLYEFRSLLIERQHMTPCLISPVEELRRLMTEDPFIPSSIISQEATTIWLGMRNIVLNRSRELARCGIPAQDYRGSLIPFLRRTVVLTAGEWWNFKAPVVSSVSPEVRAILDAVLGALHTSTPRLVRNGESHLPFILDTERDGKFELTEEARRVAVIRCSRGSHLNHGECHPWADAMIFDTARTTSRFDEVPYGVVDFMRHVVAPFTKEEEARKVAHAEAFIEANRPDDATHELIMKQVEKSLSSRFTPGRYPGWF